MVKIELSEADQSQGNWNFIFFRDRKSFEICLCGWTQNWSVLAALFTLKHLAPKQIFYDNSHSRVCLSLTNILLKFVRSWPSEEFVASGFLLTKARKRRRKLTRKRRIFQLPGGFQAFLLKFNYLSSWLSPSGLFLAVVWDKEEAFKDGCFLEVELGGSNDWHISCFLFYKAWRKIFLQVSRTSIKIYRF